MHTSNSIHLGVVTIPCENNLRTPNCGHMTTLALAKPFGRTTPLELQNPHHQ